MARARCEATPCKGGLDPGQVSSGAVPTDRPAGRLPANRPRPVLGRAALPGRLGEGHRSQTLRSRRPHRGLWHRLDHLDPAAMGRVDKPPAPSSASRITDTPSRRRWRAATAGRSRPGTASFDPPAGVVRDPVGAQSLLGSTRGRSRASWRRTGSSPGHYARLSPAACRRLGVVAPASGIIGGPLRARGRRPRVGERRWPFRSGLFRRLRPGRAVGCELLLGGTG